MATSGDEIAVAPSMAVSGPGPEHPQQLQGIPPPPAADVLHQPNPFFKPQNVGSVGIVSGVAQLAVLPGAMGQGSSLVDNARRGPQPTICEHQLPKSKCKKCKAMARICKHGKKKELCRECDGSALCVHDLRKKVPVQPSVSRAHVPRPASGAVCPGPLPQSSQVAWPDPQRAACRSVGSAMAPPCASTTRFGGSVKIAAAAATASMASANAGLNSAVSRPLPDQRMKIFCSLLMRCHCFIPVHPPAQVP